MPNASAIVLSAVGALVLGVLLAVPAAAKIVCKDGFQQTKGGGWLSTPYCNDEHLAEIARRHGVKVTGKQVRASRRRSTSFAGSSGSALRRAIIARMTAHRAAGEPTWAGRWDQISLTRQAR